MSKLRSISTSFWSDPAIEDMTPEEKLLFLYLVTNDKTNMLGIYEVSIKKIAFETGLDKEIVLKALKGFESIGKVKYENNYIILCNFLKHQHFNTNMIKSAIDSYNELPKSLQIKDLIVSKDNPSEGFESLCIGFGMVRKVEVEVKSKVEDENEDKNKGKVKKEIPLFEEFLIYAVEHKPKVSKNELKLKYESWVVNDWKDGHNVKIINWKSKLLNTLKFLGEEQTPIVSRTSRVLS